MTLVGRALAGVASLLLLALAQTAQAAPALWAVRDHDSTIYLFGTMHSLSPDTVWRTPALETAMAEATVVWFETDVTADANTMGPLMLRHGFDFQTPLKDKVSPATMAAVRAAVKESAVALVMVEKMQPWMAALLVQTRPAATGNLTAAAGADNSLGRDARRRGQTVRYFEDIEGQIRILADMPLAAQILFLEDSLAGSGPGDALLVGEGVWLNGDVQLYGSAVNAEMRDTRPALYEALLLRRNRQWVRVLTREMRGKGVQIVNVGALHLVGEDGLVVQLRKRGFVVERIQ